MGDINRGICAEGTVGHGGGIHESGRDADGCRAGVIAVDAGSVFLPIQFRASDDDSGATRVDTVEDGHRFNHWIDHPSECLGDGRVHTIINRDDHCIGRTRCGCGRNRPADEAVLTDVQARRLTADVIGQRIIVGIACAHLKRGDGFTCFVGLVRNVHDNGGSVATVHRGDGDEIPCCRERRV